MNIKQSDMVDSARKKNGITITAQLAKIKQQQYSVEVILAI